MKHERAFRSYAHLLRITQEVFTVVEDTERSRFTSLIHSIPERYGKDGMAAQWPPRSIEVG